MDPDGTVVSLSIDKPEAGYQILRWKVDYPPSQPVGSGFEPPVRSTG